MQLGFFLFVYIQTTNAFYDILNNSGIKQFDIQNQSISDVTGLTCLAGLCSFIMGIRLN
jgi:hypothetical protein|tara:strand:+ start:259627 stop:259803 length:177 start_codon:yes stop_codon:yes gene_type:complete